MSLTGLRPEITILALGILSALAGLQNIKDIQEKNKRFRIIFFFGLFTAILMNILQFYFSVNNEREGRKHAQNAIAIALYPFESKDLSMLKAVAPDSFLVGYRRFKDGEWIEAKALFNDCVRYDQYVAPSKYLLAYMDSHAKNGRLCPDGDYAQALDELQQAVQDDPNYAPAYYLKAVLLADGRQIKPALDALEKAVYTHHSGYIPALDINDPEEVNKYFTALTNQTRFIELQKGCHEVQNLP